jgi:hypothetical protein
MHTFTQYLAEAEEVHTTGHPIHLADHLLKGNITSALAHTDAITDRFNNKNTKGKNVFSLKVDGGISTIAGMDQDGKLMVGYKSGTMIHHDEDSIEKHAKPYHKKIFKQVLNSLRGMKNLKRGTAFQADVINAPDHEEPTVRPNAITYKAKPGHLYLGVHSQYAISKSGANIIKTSDVPDLSQLRGEGVHTPNLNFHPKMNFSLSSDRHHKIKTHRDKAERAMASEGTTEFFQGLSADKGKESKKFNAMIQSYAHHTARTTGEMSVDGLHEFANAHVHRKNQKTGEYVTKTESNRAATEEHHSNLINDNREHFENLVTAHNSLTTVTNEFANVLRNHGHNFPDVQVRANKYYGEHEGMVSTLPDHGMSKIVRRGPKGFQQANAESAKERFGSTP